MNRLDDDVLTETGLEPVAESGRVLLIACGALAREILALREAKRLGDASRVEALQEQLGWVSTGARTTSIEVTPVMRTAAQRLVPGGPDPLLYDQVASDATWPAGQPESRGSSLVSFHGCARSSWGTRQQLQIRT